MATRATNQPAKKPVAKAKKKRVNEKRLRARSIQYWGSLCMILACLAGAGFSIYTIYFGIRIFGADTENFSTIMAEYNMSMQQIATCVIVMGSILLVFYILALLYAYLTLMTAGRILRKRTLFWVGLALLILNSFFYTVGCIDLWLMVLVNLAGIVLEYGIYLNIDVPKKNPVLSQIDSI